MKKSVLVMLIALTTFSLMAFGLINWNKPATCKASKVQSETIFPGNVLYNNDNPKLVYDVESRFMATVTKHALDNAKSIVDILPTKATNPVASYINSSVSVLDGDNWRESSITTENGLSEMLNPAQIKLMQSTNYSTNIRVNSICMRKNAWNAEEEYDLVYYMTVVPEKEASYTEGYEKLISYLKENSKEETLIIDQRQLRPGRVSFVVSKEGNVESVNLDASSGYPSIDEKLIELTQNIPGAWNVATNWKGEKVDQEFIFFFGQKGC